MYSVQPYCRIAEQLRLEGTSGDQVARTVSSQDGDPTTSLHSLFQYFVTCTVKKKNQNQNPGFFS